MIYNKEHVLKDKLLFPKVLNQLVKDKEYIFSLMRRYPVICEFGNSRVVIEKQSEYNDLLNFLKQNTK